jgi:hypothetical protein
MVRVLLDRGATVDSEDNLGQTPLHMVSRGAYISQDDSIRIAQLLLKRGADVHCARQQPRDPGLDFARQHGKHELDIIVTIATVDDKTNAKIDKGLNPNLLELKCDGSPQQACAKHIVSVCCFQ